MVFASLQRYRSGTGGPPRASRKTPSCRVEKWRVISTNIAQTKTFLQVRVQEVGTLLIDWNHQDTWILSTWRTTPHFFKENFGTHLAAHHCEPTINFFLPLHCVSPRCLCPLSAFHQAPGGGFHQQIFRGIWGKRRSWILKFWDKKIDQLETTPWEKKA